ncbi:hypothetical protein [Lacinutrix algicola]|uniref:hypothetical protein n=1 Tax=Lacinutrix algicola TaxID=342954 RepID=UPI0006E38418|nr:hypothetical protein [Lacinutrix algicola]
MGKYKIGDISVGDEVYFKLDYQPNYDLYWTVISIDDPRLYIEIDEMGQNDRISIHINDVYSHIKKT